MGLRHPSIRLRVFLLVLVPLFSLIAVYLFAIVSAAGTAVSLSSAGKVAGSTITPVSRLMAALDAERMLAVAYLDSRSGAVMASLLSDEAATGRALRVVDSVSRLGPVTANASALEKAAAATLLRAARGLPRLRAAVARGGISRAAVISGYSAVVTDGTRVLEQSIQKTDVAQPLVTTALQEVNLYESEQLVLEENDIYSGDVLAGRLLAPDQKEFAQLVSLRQYLVADAVPQLDPFSGRLYRHYVPAALTMRLTRLESAIIGSAAGTSRPPVPAAQWQATARTYVTHLQAMLTQGPNWIQSQVTTSARRHLITLIAAAILGLLAVIASVASSAIMGARLLRRLADLRETALELAHDRLPGVMARLREGGMVDIDAEAPPPGPGTDEIDQVRRAFSSVHRAAVTAAVDEANLRRGVNEVFRNLARRSQVLLHRQLGLLDGMERKADEAGQLEDLFRIDHLTTRMRRHAEGLIILSGESPGRSWRQPVPFIDVLRAAAAEVEDYTRISVHVPGRAALVGTAVADVVHLLAELAENATIFSPPNTRVQVRGDLVGRGFAVEIEDRGLGISGPRLDEINRDLASLPAFDMSGSDRLGLFIAGRLAHRHDIKVSLCPSAYGGTCAVVIIPAELVTSADSVAAIQAENGQ